MSNRSFFKAIGFFVILAIFITTSFAYAKPRSAQNTIYINLVYPQKSNTLKREPLKIEKPPILKGEVFINILGISTEQLNNPNLYVEYFLNNDLVYSTQNKKLSRQNPFSFTLDTTKYADGMHTLVVNLWDKDGPAAIGIRKIIIQNLAK